MNKAVNEVVRTVIDRTRRSFLQRFESWPNVIRLVSSSEDSSSEEFENGECAKRLDGRQPSAERGGRRWKYVGNTGPGPQLYTSRSDTSS